MGSSTKAEPAIPALPDSPTDLDLSSPLSRARSSSALGQVHLESRKSLLQPKVPCGTRDGAQLPTSNAVAEGAPVVRSVAFVSTESYRLLCKRLEAVLWHGEDMSTSRLQLRSGKAGGPTLAETVDQSVRQIMWHDVRCVKQTDQKFEITISLREAGKWLTFRVLKRAEYDEWCRALDHWMTAILYRRVQDVPPMVDEKMRYQMHGILTRSAARRSKAPRTRHFYRCLRIAHKTTLPSPQSN